MPSDVKVGLSQVGLAIANNMHSNARTKHINLRYHYSREKTLNGEIELKYVESRSNLADMFTKPLGPTEFQRQRNRLGLLPRTEEDQERINHRKTQVQYAIAKSLDLRGRVDRIKSKANQDG